MNLRNRRSLCQTGILTLSLLLGTQPLWAGSSDDGNRPGAGAMAADLLVARPLLIGLEKPAQIVPMNATVSDIIHIAAIAAYDALAREKPAGLARAAE